jgi:hypothetical protein
MSVLFDAIPLSMGWHCVPAVLGAACGRMKSTRIAVSSLERVEYICSEVDPERSWYTTGSWTM